MTAPRFSSTRLALIGALAAIAAATVALGILVFLIQQRAEAGLRGLAEARDTLLFTNELEINVHEFGVATLTQIMGEGDRFEHVSADASRDNAHWIRELGRLSLTPEALEEHRQLSTSIARYETMGAKLVAQRKQRDAVLANAIREIELARVVGPDDSAADARQASLADEVEAHLVAHLAQPSVASLSRLAESTDRVGLFLAANVGSGGASSDARHAMGTSAVTAVRRFLATEAGMAGSIEIFLKESAVLDEILDAGVQNAASLSVASAHSPVRSKTVRQ